MVFGNIEIRGKDLRKEDALCVERKKMLYKNVRKRRSGESSFRVENDFLLMKREIT
jgi:hypothetical protein